MESGHIVKSFDDELNQLHGIIAEMGGLCEQQLALAIDALVKRDRLQAERVIRSDKQIDRLEEEVDNLAISILALRQPMAEDLRSVIAGLKTASNLERIGDYAKNIAKRSEALTQSEQLGNATGTIQRMGNLVQGMIKNVLDAYLEGDGDKAEDVRARDEEVDLLHTSLFRELLTYMMESPGTITPCTHLLFIAKNIERMGDHATNIAEYVHFRVHGHPPGEARQKGDGSSTMVVEPMGN
ncbi:MAG: phosphate signaling complex protein PhoU [Rhodospirillales bacterium]|nr:phosphate signaling complex protein PhoU [Rhodospirillales bacterium]